MDPILLNISYIGIILFIGLLSSIISRKLKIPNLLLLILVGMILGSIKYNNKQIVEFSPLFLASLAVITLAMVVFHSSSRFNFRKFDTMSVSALKLSLIFLFLNLIFLSIITYYIFKPASFLLAILFAAVISGTDPSSTLMILAGARSRLFELLKVEAILNTPLIVLIPFLLIDIIKNLTGESTLAILSSQLMPFAQQFVTGIGTGILIALIFLRVMKRYYSVTLSPLAIIIIALLTYAIAETLGGNGVLSVTTAGIMFGNLYRVKHMRKLQEFGSIFSEVLEILVFVLIGSVIKIPFTTNFLIPSSILFIIYLVLRFISVQLSFRKATYTLKEKLYMTLNISKGIAVAVVVFTLATKVIIGMNLILNLIFLFMIYSIILSTIVTHFSKFFTKVEIKISEEQ
ncbi:cation:proton antiporter [Candidatus Woesearchaeota archaeon]|nr:cation:proton antiporter [Candidatus Woesearchaeota archaeon]